MKSIKSFLGRITALFILFVILLSNVCLQNAYAQDTYIPALINIEAELLDFTITNSVTFSGKQGETNLTITPIIIANNSSEKFINVSSVKYTNTLSDLSLKASDTDFALEGNSYSIVMNGDHDFSLGNFAGDVPIMINGGQRTFTFTGKIGAQASAYSNVECGNFVITISGTTEPSYNNIPITQLENVSWSTGTDKQIVAIMDAAYDGIIDPSEYCGWKIGDERTVKISAFRTVYNFENTNQSGQYNADREGTLVIYNKGGEYLTNGQECKYVVGFKEALVKDQWYSPTAYYNYNIGDGENNYNNSFVDRDCTAIFDVLPEGIKPIFKEWQVYVSGPTTIIGKTLDSVSWITDHSTIQCLNRYFALPALNNVYAIEEQDPSIERNIEDEYVKTKYEYFNNLENVKKVLVPDSSAVSYWLRTPNSCYKRSNYFTTYNINSQGAISLSANMSSTAGVSPVGCI